ncbi:hypothetical protein AVEN_31742-1 [Araneus ventricosus]|uniref:Uncharacterized protein n=1 Tax=Araneus ventricosus TaxID=182803 RepID=A0A4Y2HMQ6_ARAVE|nr:hypothetical protein AVEN_31742-1 [Araneus ventricosus]
MRTRNTLRLKKWTLDKNVIDDKIIMTCGTQRCPLAKSKMPMKESNMSYTEASSFHNNSTYRKNRPKSNSKFHRMQFVVDLQIPCFLPSREKLINIGPLNVKIWKTL